MNSTIRKILELMAILAVCAVLYCMYRGTEKSLVTEEQEAMLCIETESEATQETAPETVQETVQETVPETVQETVQETVPETESEATLETAPEAESETTELRTEQRYYLTDAERWEIASVLTAEATGEPYAGKMAVAQCILQACEDDGIRPAEAVVKYRYATGRPDPSVEALEAVVAVFDLGQVVTNKPIKYFYAPARCYSAFHESQDYVLTINNHKFFAEVKK